jgi:hypothetical protein
MTCLIILPLDNDLQTYNTLNSLLEAQQECPTEGIGQRLAY